MSSELLEEIADCINNVLDAKDEVSLRLMDLISQKPLALACTIHVHP